MSMIDRVVLGWGNGDRAGNTLHGMTMDSARSHLRPHSLTFCGRRPGMYQIWIAVAFEVSTIWKPAAIENYRMCKTCEKWMDDHL